MNCGNCNKPFEGRNFGVIVRGGVVDLCSVNCRGQFRREHSSAGTPKKRPTRSGDAENGVRIQRKPTQSEIKRKLRPKEGDISKSIAGILDGAGVWNTRVQSGKIKIENRVVTMSKAGTPDRVAAIGVPVWIEVKRSGETATAVQLETHAKLKEGGSLVFVVDDPAAVPVILRGLRSFKPEIEVIGRLIREMQNTIDGDLERDRFNRGVKA